MKICIKCGKENLNVNPSDYCSECDNEEITLHTIVFDRIIKRHTDKEKELKETIRKRNLLIKDLRKKLKTTLILSEREVRLLKNQGKLQVGIFDLEWYGGEDVK